MTKQEAEIWFWNKFYSCYFVQNINNPEKIFMFYNEQYARQIKLSKLLKNNIKIPNKITGICLFELDFKNKNLCYSTDDIFYFLYCNYKSDYNVVYNLIHNKLKKINNLNKLRPIFGLYNSKLLKNHDNLNIINQSDINLIILNKKND